MKLELIELMRKNYYFFHALMVTNFNKADDGNH